MPLKKEVTERFLPDSEGWYWLKIGNAEFQPVKVNPPGNGWPPTIHLHGQSVEVGDSRFTWGDQITPP